MSTPIQAIRGMNDILPPQTHYFSFLEQNLAQLAISYGYQEIRLPIVEQTALFKRGIGDGTDIVEKEMYIFEDRNGMSIALRPESTAVCARAGIEHGLLYNQIQRFWNVGPMFRHERPQKGRYRQFHQFSVEAFGMEGAAIEAEIIFMSARIWEILGLKNVVLQLNSLGSHQARAFYRQQLINYFLHHKDVLDQDSQRRLQINPLRILDSKNPDMQALIANAPILTDYLDEVSQAQFNQLRHLLDHAGINYVVNPRLVRGLDYYNGLVFEWVTDQLGSQNAVCSGGRYDTLVELLGGKPTPAIGFSAGLERIVELMQLQITLEESLDIYFILVGEKATEAGLLFAEQWRRELPGLRIETNCGGASLKTQFKRADKSGARIAIILGEDEIASHSMSVKYLREELPQLKLPMTEVSDFLRKIL